MSLSNVREIVREKKKASCGTPTNVTMPNLRENERERFCRGESGGCARQ